MSATHEHVTNFFGCHSSRCKGSLVFKGILEWEVHLLQVAAGCCRLMEWWIALPCSLMMGLIDHWNRESLDPALLLCWLWGGGGLQKKGWGKVVCVTVLSAASRQWWICHRAGVCYTVRGSRRPLMGITEHVRSLPDLSIPLGHNDWPWERPAPLRGHVWRAVKNPGAISNMHPSIQKGLSDWGTRPMWKVFSRMLPSSLEQFSHLIKENNEISSSQRCHGFHPETKCSVGWGVFLELIAGLEERNGIWMGEREGQREGSGGELKNMRI